MLVPSIYLSVANTPHLPARLAPKVRLKKDKRRGVVLLIVLVMLVMFATIGLAFMFYAESDSAMASAYRDSMASPQGDIDPEQAFAFFLQQLIYDCNDGTAGRMSALRGHSLMRTMYGQNYSSNPNAATMTLGANNTPYNGTGRVHYLYNTLAAGAPGAAILNPAGGAADDYNLVSYQYFPQDKFVRDPERIGPPRAPGTNAAIGTYVGFNAPYTYADLNTMCLAAVRNDGTVLSPSFHRNYNGITLNPSDGGWSGATDAIKPVDHPPINGKPGFAAPEDPNGGGDVRNRPPSWGPPGNDSIWMYCGAPIWTLPDGRKYTMLHAPLIIDLDSKPNINTHGNIAGTGNVHVGNQGFGGPTEVNLSTVLTAADVQRLVPGFKGNGVTTSTPGRYGKNLVPGTGSVNFNPTIVASTVVAATINIGVQTVTPASMQGIVVGTNLQIGTGATNETVVVTAVTPAAAPTSFTATFVLPHTGPVAVGVLIVPHFYAQVDFDGRPGAASAPWSMPTSYQPWPSYPGATFGNAGPSELFQNSLLFNPVSGGGPTMQNPIAGPFTAALPP